MQEIKFCQFCRNNELDIEVTLDRESGKKYRVHCRQCGANGPLRNDEDNAILWWNNRINEVPEMLQEEPTIVTEYMEKKYCPILSGNCRTVDCMMYVYTHKTGSGLDGRCGLVNTMYINSTGCGA